MIGVEAQIVVDGTTIVTSDGFGAAFYRNGPVSTGGLEASNQMVKMGSTGPDGTRLTCPGKIVGGWCPAATAPGPDVGQTYTGQVTLTNTSSQPVTHISGQTAGESCWQFGLCTRYLVNVTPTGTANLDVTGVAADGSLEAQGSASSVTTIYEYISQSPSIIYSATQLQPTTVSISSQPQPFPSTGPTPPASGNPDLRGLEFPPHGVQGPLEGGTTVVASNNFQIPAFTSPAGSADIALVFNPSIGGWDANGSLRYVCFVPPCPAIAGEPGWNQFSASTTVVQVGVSQAVPQGFTWTKP
jgi:hypothetical protein